jgi:DNA-binding transcriptional regulator YiaG
MFMKGKDIAALRHALGLNLREFAELLGVTEAAVCYWEADKRRPRYPMMERLHRMRDKMARETATV